MLQRIRRGETSHFDGVVISYDDYIILRKRKEYLERNAWLEARLNAGEDA